MTTTNPLRWNEPVIAPRMLELGQLVKKRDFNVRPLPRDRVRKVTIKLGGDNRVISKTKRYTVLTAAAQEFGVTIEGILSRLQTAHIVAARRAAMRCLHEQGYGFSEIGRSLGRHHASVMHLVRGKTLRSAVKLHVPASGGEVPYPDFSGEWAI